eukprot:CAMPEP_0198278624 /NCGR_PEP_ID=MMETSP1447-20131203/66472_1 /TAXON_ID=420782 /ORGANISM="Chaetoceros dichaeta, Strain CCMP1751" /LENGTH=232 /DNA_ID=CAMNT_0043973713 /DNA_START=181 /DNA_END=879 /DNA_ORIENTATION=-
MTTYRMMTNNIPTPSSQQAPFSIRAAYANFGPTATVNQPNQHTTTTMTKIDRIQQQLQQQQRGMATSSRNANFGPTATVNQPNQHTIPTMTKIDRIQQQQQHQQQQQRGMATSSRNERRKNKNHKSKRGQSQLWRNNAIATAASKHSPSSSKFGSKTHRHLIRNPSALLFLGVFPAVMTGILVFVRDDLREQVKDNWGMFFKTKDASAGGVGAGAGDVDSDETTDEFHKKNI